MHWFERSEKVISVIANIAVIVGIIFALIQIIQSNNFEKRRVAIEAISPIRSNAFLMSYAKLIEAYHQDQLPQSSLTDDLNYIMNVYDNIAILYLNGLADKKLIKENSYTAIKKLAPILDQMSYPKQYRSNFDRLLNQMDAS